MRLEDQVCSLDLARKLKALGVKQESHFYWNKEGNGFVLTESRWSDKKSFSAFTVAELGEMLPTEINWGQGFKYLEIIRVRDEKKEWHVRYYKSGSGIAPKGACDKTEANARAKMLAYLIEQDIVKP